MLFGSVRLLVKHAELTILRSGRAFVIPKSIISKVEMRRRDSPVEGALVGAVTGILLGLGGGWQGCPIPDASPPVLPFETEGSGVIFRGKIASRSPWSQYL